MIDSILKLFWGKEMPTFTHDCDDCRFLGTIKVKSFRFPKKESTIDSYHCPLCDGGTIVLRYGNNGPDYASMPIDSIPSVRDSVRASAYRWALSQLNKSTNL